MRLKIWPCLDHAFCRSVLQRQKLVAAGPIDSGQPEDVNGKAVAAPESEPLRLREKPLVAALGIGRQRRLLGDERAAMIAIDPGGREIADPAELARTCREERRMLPQNGIALRTGRCRDDDVRDPARASSGSGSDPSNTRPR